MLGIPSETQTAARQLRERGHVLVRGAFPADTINVICREVARFFSDFEARMAAAQVSEVDRGLYETFGNLTFDRMVESGFGGVAALFPAIRASKLAPVIAAHFGEAIHVPRNHVLGRYYQPPYGNVVPYHQDVTVIDPRASVTTWIPLNECGAAAPGLELANALITAPLPITPGDYTITADVIEWDSIRPVFKPGDAVLFLNTTPHRSYVTPDMTRPRYSFEVRYMPASAINERDDAANLVDVTP